MDRELCTWTFDVAVVTALMGASTDSPSRARSISEGFTVGIIVLPTA